ncbi:MAG: SUMF1/EgtB/PvdO family nonheme iron enzyme [Planctomycetes bacterium]|nr:SUMF1/EgtB/PvdO family nonheme iron enzyme [Planctomycetota bacterium]
MGKSSRAARAWVALCIAGCLTACGGTSSPREDALSELEQLAFIPAGSVSFPPLSGRSVECANAEPLLVDRYEVPRGRWLRYQRQRATELDPQLTAMTAGWTEDTWSWAASWMTLEEARAFARSRGMRLMTAREWVRVAVGLRGLRFPWGENRASLVANTLELGLSRPIPVGTFELGATPNSTYDLCGNVWEWVEDPIDRPIPDESDPNSRAWAMGGSFASPLAPMYEVDQSGRLKFQNLTLDPRARGDDIGVRCAVEAREYLRLHAEEFGDDEAAHARLVSVGRRFGRDAVPLLESLVAETRNSRALRWLLEGASK